MTQTSSPNTGDTLRIELPFQVIKPTATIAPDCRHYLGDRPCIHNRLCRGCTHYSPYEQRICIIKLGALGDVIRTLCILPELRERHRNAHITWITLPNACRMIDGHPMIDRVLPFNQMTAMVLPQERFDTVISLDKEPEPCALAMSLFGKRKLGIGLSDHGTPVPINPEARDYFHLGLSDELKFNQNTKSYPQLIHDALGYEYGGHKYELPLDEQAQRRESNRLISLGWNPSARTLGINVGAGNTFANKMIGTQQITGVIRAVHRQAPDIQVLLLGGPSERDAVNVITNDLRQHGHQGVVIDTGTDHSEQSFVAIVDLCDVLFTGDTMAMHVGIARGISIVAFFGPTCEQEIDLFGLGEKLIAKVPCGPCYKRECDQNNACLNQITTDDAARAIGRVMEQAHPASEVAPGQWRKAG